MAGLLKYKYQQVLIITWYPLPLQRPWFERGE